MTMETIQNFPPAIPARPGFPVAAPRAAQRGWANPIPWLLWLLCLGLVARQTLFIRQRSMGDFAIVDRYAIFQILIVLASLLVVLLSGRMDRLWRGLAPRASGPLLIFYLFGAVSSLWSPSPAYSLYRSVEAIGQIAAIHLALTYSPSLAAAERRILALILLSMFFGMFSLVILYRFRFAAISWHDNQYTVPAALVLTYAFGELVSGRRDNRRLLWICGGLGLFGVILGTSSASFLAVLCGMGVAMLRWLSRGKYVVLFSLILVSAILLGGLAPLEKLIFYGKSRQKIEQLSGRTYLWTGYWKEFTDKPILGNGFAVSARLSSYFRTTNTHNSALSVLLGTGLAGMALVLLFLRRLLKDGLRVMRRAPPGATGATAALVAGLLNSMSVAYLGETWMMSSFSFICVLAFFSWFVAAPLSARRPRIVLRPKAPAGIHAPCG